MADEWLAVAISTRASRQYPTTMVHSSAIVREVETRLSNPTSELSRPHPIVMRAGDSLALSSTRLLLPAQLTIRSPIAISRKKTTSSAAAQAC